MNIKRVLLIIVTSLSGLLLTTTPIFADTLATNARVGFTKVTENNPITDGPTTPIQSGNTSQSNSELTNPGYQLTNTTTPTNRYLPQTDETTSNWAPMVGGTILTASLAAYVIKQRQLNQLKL